MFKKAELLFWDYTIRCMQKPGMRNALRKLSIFNWTSIKIATAAVAGGYLGLLAAYLLQVNH